MSEKIYLVTKVDGVAPVVNNVPLNAVAYTAQSLTASQKAQARENINACATDGYYETLYVGGGDNLVDRKTSGVSREFTHDTSCRDASISDDGTAVIQSLHGRTIVPNQLVEDKYKNSKTGDGFVEVTDAIAGNVSTAEFIGETIVMNQLIDSSATTITPTSGRVYYSSIAGDEAIFTSDGSALTVTGGTDMLIDLTLMFGAGNEPETLAELSKKIDISSYIAYNAGQLVNNESQWSTNVWNQLVSKTSKASGSSNGITYTNNGDGTWRISGQATADSEYVISDVAIPVAKGHVYYISAIENSLRSGIFVQFADSESSAAAWVATITQSSSNATVKVNVDSGVQASLTITPQVIDLTALFGAGNEPSSIMDARTKCLALGKDLTAYNDFTESPIAMGGTVDLTGYALKAVGTACDKYNAISGVLTRNIGAQSVTGASGATISLTGCDTSVTDYISNCGNIGTLSAGILTLTTAVTGAIVYYKLATPTTESKSLQALTLHDGLNTIFQTNSNVGYTELGITYWGTDYNIALHSAHKYLFRDGGSDSIFTGRSTQAVVGGSDHLVDLTKMFGSGKEPATVSALYALYPLMKGDMEYSAGSLVSNCMTGIKTIGFNLYNHATGTAELLGGHQYQISGTYTSVSYLTKLGNTETLSISNGIFTPVNAGTLTVVGGDSTTCVHFTWSGYRNGEYEEYWTNTLNIPVTTIQDHSGAVLFPDGLRSAGSAYDELMRTKAVKRIGKVDLGTLTWELESSSVFSTSGIAAYCTDVSANLACGIYEYYSHAYNALENMEMCLDSNKKLYIKNTSYSTAAAFKTAMSGVYLYYEYAAPVTVTFDDNQTTGSANQKEPLNMSYKVADFGVEQCIPQSTASVPSCAPVDGVIAYSTDFTRQLATMNKNYMSTDSLDSLLTVLGNAIGGTITKTWDSTNNKWTFSISQEEA